ncbi:MAG: S-layer homology domain-containing protein [Clostridiaceae bacterium]|nr:S-layer homology domain-containing protein [Clostridiaceae bacterium]
MNTRKRFYLILVALIVFLTSILPTTVMGQTVDEKADALNHLSILASPAKDSNLTERLSRAHAAAFIVRLIGIEDDVIKYADIYSITSFPDVDPSQWYAKYVGYCAKEKIIVGTAAGKFEPTGYISEKAFLRLVLSALGYIYNEDYPLEEVYTRAFSLGLVTDPSYYGRTMDNAYYTRGEAVDVLYNALKVINKKTGKEMFYSLIDSGAITREAAVKAGLITDTDTTIEEIKPLDFNKVYIRFNESIKPVSSENIVMYAHGKEADKIECSLASLDKNELVLYAPNKGSKKIYDIKLLNVEDENGNITKEILGVFAGYEMDIDEVESDYFRIKSIEGINEKSIKVLFTHPVNENTELPQLYSIYEEDSFFAGGNAEDMAVKVNSSSDGVILTLNKKVFSTNGIYSLKINGDLTSAYGVKLNDGADDIMKFVASSDAAEPFALIEIIPLNNKTVLLQFNKEINPVIAGQKYSFLITDQNGKVIEIEKTGVDKLYSDTGNIMFINIKDTFVMNNKYLLTIYILSDVARQEYINEEEHSFTADYGSSDDFRISSVYAIDNKTIEVYFSAHPDKNKVSIANYYNIRGDGFSYAAIPEKVFYDVNVDPYSVKLYLPENMKLANNNYYLSIDSRMQDYIGNSIGNSIKEYFSGTSDPAAAPGIYDAVTISSDSIKLTFNREIALDALNILTSNYILEYSVSGTQYKKVPLSVIYINAKTVILKFDSLVKDDDISFIIKYNKLKDYSGVEGIQGQTEVRHGDK